MIVVDTSAWIEYFRNSAHPVNHRVRALLASRAELAITEAVFMEMLGGVRSARTLDAIRSQLVGLPLLRLEGVDDFEQAAAIYRACRASGHTLRGQVDLLIAVPTIRHGASLLHNDRDFEVIARHSGLKLEPLRSSSEDGGDQIREGAGIYGRRSPRPTSRTSRNSRSKRLASKA